MSNIVCLGITTVDIIAKPVNIMPENGKLTLVDKIETHTGGCAVNTSIDLSRIGQDVGIISLVGNDTFGNYVKSELKNEKVNVDGLSYTDRAANSASIVLSNKDGERSFIHCLGTNGIFTEKDINMKIIEDCKYLFIAGALLMPAFDGEPTAGILKKAKELGKYTILDTAWDSMGRWMTVIKPCLPYIDLFIPSIDEARMLSDKNEEKEIADDFLRLGAKNVVIKLGSKGCYVKNDNIEFYSKSFNVNCIDTTGAGDAFVAGFITGLSSGWNIKECAEFANATGAFCVREIGASVGIKSKEEILSFIHK